MSNNNNNLKNKCGNCRTEFAKELNQQRGQQVRNNESQMKNELERVEGLKDR